MRATSILKMSEEIYAISRDRQRCLITFYVKSNYKRKGHMMSQDGAPRKTCIAQRSSGNVLAFAPVLVTELVIGNHVAETSSFSKNNTLE